MLETRDIMAFVILAVAIGSFACGFCFGQITGYIKGRQEMRRALRGRDIL